MAGKSCRSIIRLIVKLGISFIIENTSIEVKRKKLTETNVEADLTIVEKTRFKVEEERGQTWHDIIIYVLIRHNKNDKIDKLKK